MMIKTTDLLITAYQPDFQAQVVTSDIEGLYRLLLKTPWGESSYLTFEDTTGDSVAIIVRIIVSIVSILPQKHSPHDYPLCLLNNPQVKKALDLPGHKTCSLYQPYILKYVGNST